MYQIPEDYSRELAIYRTWVDRMPLNEHEEVEFKIYRVIRGIYEQRKKGSYMLRIRCSGGAVTPDQLLGICKIAGRYKSSTIHITTRQELQLHNLKLSDTPDILEELYSLGLSTKGSGGNTVRNITASVDSGIAAGEVFDVLPYNLALTNLLLNYEKSFELPRKLKIAFSNSDKDSALAAFNDLGFVARIRNGIKGFQVYLGGSPSVKPMVGEILFDFIPAEKIFGVALAVIELFDRYGNRKNRHKARLRYLFYKLGKEKVFELFEDIHARYKNQQTNSATTFSFPKPAMQKFQAGIPTDEKYIDWKEKYVRAQKQESLYSVEIPIMHGNITAEKLNSIATFAQNVSMDSIRFSRRQNIHLRNIPEAILPLLYHTLKKIVNTGQAYVTSNLVSCTGADTCQLGICFSKGGLQAIYDKLQDNPNVDQLNDLTINISGCPNSCGQHLIADLGFAGRVSRKEKIYPAYTVFAGALVGNGHPALPINIGEIAAKDLPEFTNDLLTLYAPHARENSFRKFVESNEQNIKKLFSKYEDIPAWTEDASYYIDWGNNELFSLAERRNGECSASKLDLIEVEIKTLEKCRESLSGQQQKSEQIVLLEQLVLSASRLLFLTFDKRNIAREKLFSLVKNKFLGENKLDPSFSNLFTYIEEGNFPALLREKDLCLDYANETLNYYKHLNDSLAENAEISNISVHDLKALLDLQSDIELIDVREDWEHKIANLGGRLIPFEKLEEHLTEIPRNKNTIIYCKNGNRSQEFTEKLVKDHKYQNVYNLAGGLNAWTEEIDKAFPKY